MKNVKQAPQLNPIHHVGGKVFRFVKEVKIEYGYEYNEQLTMLVPRIVINKIYRTIYKGRWKQVSTEKGNELHRQLSNN